MKETSGTARLFTALWPNSAVRQALADSRKTWSFPLSARLVRPEQLHLTLNFLGDVPGEKLVQLRQLQVPLTPFDLDLNRPALWQDDMAVLEADRLPAELIELHDSLRKALQGLGLSLESRPFRPHVTLARRARHAKLPVEIPVAHWHVDAYVLVQSQREPAGRYRVLHEYSI